MAEFWSVPRYPLKEPTKAMKRKQTIIRTAALLAALAHADAAPITWDSTQAVIDASDVSTTGTLVEALNLGYTNAGGGNAFGLANQTVNGVTFTAAVGPAPLTTTGGDPYNQLAGGDTGDDSYNALLNSVAFGGGGGVVNFTIGGSLTVGQEYELQAWFVEERSLYNTRTMQFGDGAGGGAGTGTVLVGNTIGTATLGEYVIGTFTADGATQTLTLDAQGFGNAHLTAYQIREISGGESGIIWGTPVNVGTGAGNSADVSTNGSLVEAYNAAITSYTGDDQTVNGVLFKATTSILDQDTVDTFDLSAGTNGGDASYDAILSTADFGGGQSTTITIGDGDGDSTVTGAGLLQVGELYEIQVWFVDDRVLYDDRTMGYAGSSSDPVASVNDQYVIGTFTATATTQDLYLDTVAPASGFGQCHLTAYQIRKLSADVKVVDTEFVPGTGFQVTFSGLDTATTYELRRSDDLQTPWNPVAGTAKIPAASTDTFTDTTATLPGPGFYRLWVVE